MKKNRINKERIYDSMLDTINYNEKLVKDELDLTAKLNQSNVFTQPQQVPNATLPQHATNLNQVETMFEMFKRELRGFNLASPDLTDKEYLGDGWYQILKTDVRDYKYNVYNGYWFFNGSNIPFNIFDFDLEIGQEYTISFYYISGEVNQGLRGNNGRPYVNIMNSGVATWVELERGYWDQATSAINNNLMFKLQIEKGDTATPYTVPGQIPQYKIVGEE